MGARHEQDFDAFVERAADGAFRTAYAIVRDDVAAHEAVRAALTQAYGDWPRLGRSAHPDLLFRRILIRTLLSVPDAPSGPAYAGRPDPRNPKPVDCDAVWSALAEIDRHHRCLIVLRYYERIPDAELATIMGVRPDSVSRLCDAAITAVQRVLTLPAHRRQIV